MKKSYLTILFLLGLSLHSCFIGADGDSENLTGNYYISGDYGLINVHLGFEDKEWGGIGLIKEPITAVGYNDNYIIVKRESEKTEFFILKIIHSGIHSTAEKNMTGPISEREFEIQINELELNNIKWTREFEKNNDLKIEIEIAN